MKASIIVSILILLISGLVESAILSNILFLPAIPDLMLICLIYISLHNGRTYGESLGFISGLILDFISGTPLGLNCLLRTIIGFSSGMLSTVLSIEGIFLPALAGFIATIFKAVLIWIISIFFPTVINTYGISASVFSSELLMNTILTPVIFKLLSFFKFLNIEQKGSQLDEV